MIKMFYYNPDEFLNRLLDNEFITYSEQDFDRLVNWQYDEEGNSIMPFRDEFSKKFLKDTWNIEFVSEDDWYSIQSPEEGRFCLSGLSKEMKYALTLLHFSSKGRKLSFKACSECIWKALNDMPFDILMVVDTSRLSSWNEVFLGFDYTIENFPFNNEFIQVHVSDYPIRDKQEVKNENGVSLFVDNDNYYAWAIDIEEYYIRYDWKKHLPDIIKNAGFKIKDEYPIIDKTLVCNVVEYAKLLGIDDIYFLELNDYTYYLYNFKRMLQEGDITQEIFDTEMLTYQTEYEADYKKYLWVKNELKICSHLYKVPNTVYQRKLPMLIIDKFSDDSYKVWGKLTVKNPEFHEILFNVIKDFYTDECERYITVVDVEEVFKRAEDIKYINCGFKITENCIEVFDRNDALKQFVNIAQEALSSEKCSISEEFY